MPLFRRRRSFTSHPRLRARPFLSQPFFKRRWIQRRWSPLTRRVLVVNLLPLVLLVAALFYLDYYRDGLIATELQALTTQGKIFAGALGEGAVTENSEGEQALRPRQARALLRRLVGPTTLKVWLFTPNGTLMIDTERLDEAEAGRITKKPLPDLPKKAGNSEKPHPDWLMQIRHRLSRLLSQNRSFPPYSENVHPTFEDFPESKNALEAIEGHAIRIRDDGQLVLTVAVPVQRYRQVVGVLVVNGSGEQIAKALQDIRQDLLRLLGGSLAISVLLSFYLAGTLASPIRRLAITAERVRHGLRHPVMGNLSKRRDEIGDLARVFQAMTAALWQRIAAMEHFAADVSHELKNPLNSIRSAFETLQKIQDPAKRQRLSDIIMEDVQRLDRLISDIADSSRLDAELQRRGFEPVDLALLLHQLAELHAASYPDGPWLNLHIQTSEPCLVEGLESRLLQVLRNLLGNAVSFSPPNGTIDLQLSLQEGAGGSGQQWRLEISDQGPGIPPTKLQDIFNRFYTERPSGEKFGQHSGLGLSISRQIVEAFGGKIHAENRQTTPNGPITGSRFVVELAKLG